ncbi:MAG: phage holin family protein [Bacillota bacterium]
MEFPDIIRLVTGIVIGVLLLRVLYYYLRVGSIRKQYRQDSQLEQRLAESAQLRSDALTFADRVEHLTQQGIRPDVARSMVTDIDMHVFTPPTGARPHPQVKIGPPQQFAYRNGAIVLAVCGFVFALASLLLMAIAVVERSVPFVIVTAILTALGVALFVWAKGRQWNRIVVNDNGIEVDGLGVHVKFPWSQITCIKKFDPGQSNLPGWSLTIDTGAKRPFLLPLSIPNGDELLATLARKCSPPSQFPATTLTTLTTLCTEGTPAGPTP